jgi:uncharacterized protein (DUF2252 family)
MMVGYQRALRQPGQKTVIEKPESVRIVMRKASRRTWKHLARERLDHVKPKIPRGDRFWSLSRGELQAVRDLFKTEDVRALIGSLKSRDKDATLEVLDAAYWVKGCSSLGRLRMAILLNVSNGKHAKDEYCLVDIKEAIPATAPSGRIHMPSDHAQRVVEGARQLAPALGERMLPTKILGRSVFLRELMPQDLKLEIDQLTCEEAVIAARFLASVVGRAHARQMDSTTRKEFLQKLNADKSKRLDAPSWLWSSVVELQAAHEAAYLEHCRSYALH